MTSEGIRALTMGKGFDFVDAGERRFKGVGVPVAVCLVAWAPGS